MGTEFIIFSPSENENDKFSENVNGLIQNLRGQDIDLGKYKEITDKQLTEMVTDCKVFESSIIKDGNKEYFRTIYSMTQGKLKLKITSICFIKNEKAYLLTFSAEFDKYEQYKKVGDEILSSFSLTK
jgi:serine/threonine-protein kinase